MTIAQYTLARYTVQLRNELNHRELTDGEAILLQAIERDMVRWEERRVAEESERRDRRRRMRP